MLLYYLISNVWKFSFDPKYIDGSRIPSESIWKFELEGLLSFQGNTFGEGHPLLRWECSKDTFYIEGFYQYGLIEFKFDNLRTRLDGNCILEDNSTISFKAEIARPLNDKLFYKQFESYLEKIWRIRELGSSNLIYFHFLKQEIHLFDAWGLKKLYYDERGYQDLDLDDELRCINYIFKLEMQSIIIFEKSNMEKVGVIYIDENRILKGLFRSPFNKRDHFVELVEMNDELTNDVIKSITEEDRIFS